ncbi:MAG: phosphatidylglycerophosphatase A [Xanthomonadales bacterium]|nr:phosphatidylglycerophosphatase A [Xanthomonadales bacterium]
MNADAPTVDRAHLREVALATPTGFLATGFGAGLAPRAPGTFGTLAAVPFAIVLKSLPAGVFAMAWIALLLLGVVLCSAAGKRIGVPDHGAIVWDEMVGYWLAVALVPLHWAWLAAAFALFRVFDIAKPWPVGWLERHVPGGWGVMLDDVAAGALTLGLLFAAEALLAS